MGISYRPDTNKWVVRIRNKKLNIDYTKCFTSKTLAKKDELRVKAEIEAGTYMKQNENMTFAQASELYMQNVVERKCRESTKNGYVGYLNNHILPYFGEKTLCNITKFDVEDFVNQLNNTRCKHIKSTNNGIIEELTDKKLSNETINHIIFLCGAIFEYMVDSDVIAKNPVKKVNKMPKETKESVFLTAEECNKLFEVAKVKNEKLYLVLLTSIVTGMRQGEVLALTWDDVDFSSNTISVNKTYSKGVLGKPKTNSSIRTVKISPKLVHLLKEHKLKAKPSNLNLVFSNEAGNYIDSRNLVNRFFKPCLKEAGLKDITWHELRHSCITALAEEKVNLKSIQKQVGHSSENTTLRIYTHATEKMDSELVDALDKLFEY